MPWITRASALTQSEMENNADIVIAYCRSNGFDNKTIAGLLANLENESSINPERSEVGGSGYGLVQWTPVSSLQNACATLGISPYTDGDIQLQVILAQLTGNPASLNTWITTSANVSNYYNSGATSDMIGVTASDFISNSMNWPSDKLAIMFMVGFERPSYDPTINHYQARMQSALNWESYVEQTGFTPRLNELGIRGNFHWYSENPFYISGYGMPNCTTYRMAGAFGKSATRIIPEYINRLDFQLLTVVSGGQMSIALEIIMSDRLHSLEPSFVFQIITAEVVTLQWLKK